MSEPIAHPIRTAVPAGRMGMRLALVSFAIALAAVNTGNNLLYLILSMVLALAAISWSAATWSMRRLIVLSHLPEEITAGEPFLAGVEVRGRFPLLPQTWVRVTLSGLPEPVEIDVPVAGGRGRGIASARVVAPARGIYGSLTCVASTGYPLDLARHRTRPAPITDQIVVLPRFTKAATLKISPAAGAPPGPSSVSRDAGRSGVDLHKLREYTGMEDARRIDWRSSARTRQLMLKEFEREQERRIDLVLDPVAGTDADFETAVERCAAILDLSHRKRFETRLITGDGVPATGRAAMRQLAAVKRDIGHGAGSVRSLHDLMRQTRPGAERIIVSADPSRATPIELG